MYDILECTLADLPRLYRYHQQELFNVRFSLKGFDYPWLLTSHDWKAWEKVLDSLKEQDLFLQYNLI